MAPDSELFNLVPVYQREVLQVSDRIPNTHLAMSECIEKLFVSTHLAMSECIEKLFVSTGNPVR